MDTIDKKWLASHQRTSRVTPVAAKAGPVVESQFSDLVKIDGGDSLSGDEIFPLYEDDPVAADVPHPLTKILQQVEKDRFHKSASVDDLDASISNSLEKREKREILFEKRSSAPGRIRFEVKEIDGERWRYGYDHTGELVNVRILLPEVV